MERIFGEILEAVGENPEREGLLKTPVRAAQAPSSFSPHGYRQIVEQRSSIGAIFDSDASEIVMVKDIELYSMCEHHLFPSSAAPTLPISPTAKS